MRSSYLILFIVLLLSSILSHGQTTQSKRPVVTKGYYAIGKNYLKLVVDSIPLSADSLLVPEINKGYYAIKDKNKQIARKPANKNHQIVKPVITKGYYAIGNNAQKLVDKE